MTVFILGLVAVAFLIGFKAGRAVAVAAHHQSRCVEAFERDQAVIDEADMGEHRG